MSAQRNKFNNNFHLGKPNGKQKHIKRPERNMIVVV